MIGRPPMSTRTDTLCPYPTRVRADAADAGSFATIDRVWREGDRVVIDLPMTVRLHPIVAEHPHLCALLRGPLVLHAIGPQRSEEHTYELQSLMRISYAVFFLKKKL